MVKQLTSFNCLAAELDTNKTHCNLNTDPSMLTLIELIHSEKENVLFITNYVFEMFFCKVIDVIWYHFSIELL